MKPGPPVAKRRGKLWHLAAVVLVVGLVFGSARAIAQEWFGPAEILLVATVTASGCVGSSVAIIRIGRKVAGRWTSALKDWGICRDGLIGLLAYLVGVGAEVAFVLFAIVAGCIATFVMLGQLASLVGR